MMASLFAGVSGLRNHQVKLNVIANNIANINTIGYKAGRVTFQEALVQTYKGAGRPSPIRGGTNPVQLGLGMQVGTIDTLFQQGGLELTGQVTDLAIQGSGFFILGDANGNRFYTRAGAFGLDGNSNLVDLASGNYVMGKMADANGQIPSVSTIGSITLPFGQQDPAKATEMVWIANNLNGAATDSIATLANAGSSSVNVVSGTAADGVGGTHTITITGNQAQQSSFTGARAGLGLGTTLGSIGVTDFSDWTITVDNSRVETISGLTAASTIDDLITAINQISGLTAELTGAGEVMITRDKAGATTDYNFQSSASAAGNTVDQVFTFGSPVGTTFQSAGGAATTFVASNSFVPSRGSGMAAGPFATTLDLVIDDETGLVTGLSGLGGGDVEISAGASGLTATTPGSELVIQTADTTHSTSINVFDSQGGRHTVAIEFYKSAIDNRWEWSVTMLGNERVVSGGTGYVMFNPDGSLNTFSYDGGASAVTIDPNTGAAVMNIAIDVGAIGDFNGLTGFATDTFTASFIRQDGYGLGVLEKIDIDQTGNITGVFTNGINRILAQIMLADFSNAAGLRRTGRSAYQVTANSGAAIEGFAGSTITGVISPGALESSAVDIAQEFTSMITAQRGFQANARIISTSDNMLDELVNIKR
ncbi:MAG: flagellar hook-basal body complex protein [Candidatus Zixiibacteriota bacterium]